MKHLLLILIFSPFLSFGQNIGAVYNTGATNQATNQKGGWGADSALVLPVMDTVRAKAYLSSGSATLRQKGRIIINSANNLLTYYDGSRFVTVESGADSAIFATRTRVSNQIDSNTSPNNTALDWEIVDMPDSNRYTSNAFGNGVWVIIGLDTTATQCYVSLDGKKFQAVTSFPKCNPYDITFYNGLFIVVSRSNWSGSAALITSPDGRNWTTRLTFGVDIAFSLQCVAGGGGRVIAMANGGTSHIVSYDGGYTWNTKTGTPSGSYRDITYIGDSTFIATNGGTVARTTDGGETFSAVTMPEAGSYWGGTYDNGRAVVLCETCDTNKIFISDDMGATWTGDPQFAEATPGTFTRSLLYVEAAMGWFVGVIYANIGTDTFGYVVRSRTADIGSWEVVQVPDMGLSYVGTSPFYGQGGGWHHIKAANSMWIATSVRGKIMVSGRRDCCRDMDDLPNGLQNVTNFGATTTSDVTLAGDLNLTGIATATASNVLYHNSATGAVTTGAASAGTLQAVTDAGATTTRRITTAGADFTDSIKISKLSTDYISSRTLSNSRVMAFLCAGSAGGYSGGAAWFTGINGGGTLTQRMFLHRLGTLGIGDFTDAQLQGIGKSALALRNTETPTEAFTGNIINTSITSTSNYTRANGRWFVPIITGIADATTSPSSDTLGVGAAWFLAYRNTSSASFSSDLGLGVKNDSRVPYIPLVISGSDQNVGIMTDVPVSRLDITGANGYAQFRLRTSYTPTSTADANGNTGDVAWDADYIYIKTAAGWKRATLATW